MKRYGVCLLLIVGLTLLTFFRMRHAAFVSVDDNINVYANPFFVAHDMPSPLRTLWTVPYRGMYIPVTYTLWSVLYRIGSGSAAPFHIANVLVHAGNAVLVFLLLATLVDDLLSALFGALLFALHPLQVEPVAWVTGMKDVLSAFFGLTAMLFYFFARRHLRDGTCSLLQYRARLALAFLCFVLGLLSKPSLAVLPLLIFALEVGWYEEKWQLVFWRLAPWGLASVVIGKVTQWVQQARMGPPSVSWGLRPLVAADALAFYLRKLVFPYPLALGYGRTPEVALAERFTYVSWLIPLGALCALAWGAQRRKRLSAAALFFLWPLPVLGFVPFIYQYYSTVSDRFVYLGLLGPALLVALFLSTEPRRRWLAAPATFVMILFAGISAHQTLVWQNTESLCRQELIVNPLSYGAHNNLAAELENRGQYEQAVRHYQRSIILEPHNPGVFLNLVTALVKLGRISEARVWVPKSSYLRSYEGELKELNDSLDQHPSRVMADYAIAKFLVHFDHLEDAEAFLNDALKLAPTSSSHFYLGAVLTRLGKQDLARTELRSALKLDPTLTAARQALERMDQPTKAPLRAQAGPTEPAG